MCVSAVVKVPMKRKFFPNNIKILSSKYTISKFEFPTTKIVDLMRARSYLLKWHLNRAVKMSRDINA